MRIRFTENEGKKPPPQPNYGVERPAKKAKKKRDQPRSGRPRGEKDLNSWLLIGNFSTVGKGA